MGAGTPGNTPVQGLAAPLQSSCRPEGKSRRPPREKVHLQGIIVDL